MPINRLIKIVFSPTGGTKKVADFLAEQLADEVIEVDLCNPHFEKMAFTSEDVVLVAMPSYGGRAPELALDRLAMLEGQGAACVLVCVYGNRAFEDTLVEMADVCEMQHFHVVGAVAAIAEHSIARQIAHDRPDESDQKWLVEAAKKLQTKIDSKTCPTLPGNRPYKPRGKGGIIPEVKETCIQCGLCAMSCPSQAIDLEEVKKVAEDRCIHCMRCVKVCPNKSRIIPTLALTRVSEMLEKVASERKENELFI